MITRVDVNYKDITSEIDENTENIGENSKVARSPEEIMHLMATMDWTDINSKFLESRNFNIFQYRGYQFTLGDVRKLIGSFDSGDNPDVDHEPVATFSLQPKAIQSASELKLQGNKSVLKLTDRG